MNIFILDSNLERNAEYHCDQHVNKMILEAAQMLCTVATLHGIKDVPYKDYGYSENIQGFLTSDDRFVNRKEAGQIAFDAGQITKLTECLFSEDLY